MSEAAPELQSNPVATMTAPLTSSEVTYESADFLAFARRIRGHVFLYYRVAAAVLAGLMVLTLVLDWALRQPLPIWQVGLGFAAAAGLWLLSTGRLQGRTVERHARKIGAAATQVFSLNAKGFESRGSSEVTLTKWSDIRGLDVVHQRLFVFLTDRAAFIVPRRAFDSEEQFEAFVVEAMTCWKAHHRP